MLSTVTARSASRHQHEDNAVRITLWRLPGQSEIGWHTHEYDYIVVPARGGTMTIETRQKGRAAYLIAAGQSYTRPKGTEHNVINETDEEIAFVEIELKASASGGD